MSKANAQDNNAHGDMESTSVIITCPNCKTQFTLPNTALPKAGRKVKCSKCAHLWLQKPIKRTPVKKATTPAITANDATKPVVHAPAGEGVVRWCKTITLAASIVLLLSVVLYYQHQLAALKPVYDAAGLYDTEGLVFTKTRVDHTRFSDKHDFRVETEVRNESPYPKKIPPIHITVLDEAGNEMGRLTHLVELEEIAPGESAYITPEINNVVDRAHLLTLDIGNRLDIRFRD